MLWKCVQIYGHVALIVVSSNILMWVALWIPNLARLHGVVNVVCGATCRKKNHTEGHVNVLAPVSNVFEPCGAGASAYGPLGPVPLVGTSEDICSVDCADCPIELA